VLSLPARVLHSLADAQKNFDQLAKLTAREGHGNPNGQTMGSIGDLYVDRTGGAGSVLYVKESGTNTLTGWAAK
jgi:hypothetical protein